MMLTILYLTLISIILIVDCSNNKDLKSFPDDKDNYFHIKEIAWDFINERGWSDAAKKIGKQQQFLISLLIITING